MSYTKTLKLEHNEVAAKINSETGEITKFPTRLPTGKVMFEKNSIFDRAYNVYWDYLSKNLSPMELRVAYLLSDKLVKNRMLITPQTSVKNVAEYLGISRNLVTPTLDKLDTMGVIRKHEGSWYFNPAICASVGTSYEMESEFKDSPIMRAIELIDNKGKTQNSTDSQGVSSAIQQLIVQDCTIKVLCPTKCPINSSDMDPSMIFSKRYPNSWRFLERELSDIEFKVTIALSLLATRGTNEIEALEKTITAKKLSELFGVSRDLINPILEKLLNYGVYMNVTVHHEDKVFTGHLLNPFLSFSGRLLHSNVIGLFKPTAVGKAFYDPEYTYKALPMSKRRGVKRLKAK